MEPTSDFDRCDTVDFDEMNSVSGKQIGIAVEKEGIASFDTT